MMNRKSLLQVVAIAIFLLGFVSFAIPEKNFETPTMARSQMIDCDDYFFGCSNTVACSELFFAGSCEFMCVAGPGQLGGIGGLQRVSCVE
jgi:hypothetical protein